MQHLWEFWSGLFWISLLILALNNSNFLILLLLSEILWGILYVLFVYFGALFDNLILFSFGFYILVFAAIEFVLGLFLIVIFKFSNSNSFNFTNFDFFKKQSTLYKWKKLYFNYLKF